jgi:hypothetical protein
VKKNQNIIQWEMIFSVNALALEEGVNYLWEMIEKHKSFHCIFSTDAE